MNIQNRTLNIQRRIRDALGKRVKAIEDNITRFFIYDGLDSIAELDNSGDLNKYYIRGTGLGGGIGDIIAETDAENPTPETYYYQFNHRGDVVLLTDTSGVKIVEHEYDAFGKLLTTNNQLRTILFSSKEFDKRSELSYYGFRFYDSESGRWMNKEPSGLDGPNLYLFVHNNPIIKLDMRGRYEYYNSGNVFGPTKASGMNAFTFATTDPNMGQSDSYLSYDFNISIGAGVGFGGSIVKCCNSDCEEIEATFMKMCVGPYAGAGVGWSVIVGINGDGCPDDYKGWFLEGGIKTPIPAIDVSGQLGVGVGGGGTGVGLGAGAWFCHYTLLDTQIISVGECKP